MTIVGDIAQGINDYSGLKGWSDIKDIFANDIIQFENIVQSYRSSKEIVDLSNHVLQMISGDNSILAKPFGRSTGKPKIHVTKEIGDLLLLLLGEISRLQNNYRHIAILVKDNKYCKMVVDFLLEHHVTVNTLDPENMIDLNTAYGVVVIPISLSKGIEFEAVIIFDANENAYNVTKQIDGKLLYVAITRALHQLSIMATSPITKYLQYVDDLVDHGALL
jgi:DNA helicase-2/ATP-dependent DNA helicase PcrA